MPRSFARPLFKATCSRLARPSPRAAEPRHSRARGAPRLSGDIPRTLSDRPPVYLQPVQDWDAFLRALPRASVRGGETFLTIDAALAAVDWIEDHGATLLGIEGFHLTADTTRPSLDHIADFSRPAPRPMDAARDLLRRWQNEVDAVVLAIETE